MEKSKNLHLLWRSGFGPDISSANDLERVTVKQLWGKIKQHTSQPLIPIAPSSSFVQDNYDKNSDPKLSKEQKSEWNRKIRRQSNVDLKEFNKQWITLMTHNPNQLGEKMSLFWHHHFAIRHANSFLQQDAINIIRKHALGNFSDLLREVSKSGAMILSLNNQQNRKNSPNENFAREVMELFSIGIGHYTERDVKEAARAFTGWGIGKDGRFVFNDRFHDPRTKSVLGQSGRLDGDDIIDIILNQQQTATFIVHKIYRYFVNENVDAQRVESLATSFRKSYDILELLDNIFGSDWFYEEQHRANKVKTPIELLVGLQRLSPVSALDEQLQYRLQRLLGQVLFNPPSIAGWPSGKNWLDSSTLMVRLQLPQIIAGKVAINMRAKSDDDANMGLGSPDDIVRLEGLGRITPNTDWNAWLSPRSESAIAEVITTSAIRDEIVSLLQNKSKGNKEEYVYSLMSLPEYQLC